MAAFSRQTSFAVLAPDTRTAMADSPFGVWCFWGSHTSTRDEGRPEKLASLLNKAGWRWTYGGGPQDKEGKRDLIREFNERYRITWTLGCPPYCKRAKPYGVLFDAAKFQAEVVPWLERSRAHRS